MRVSVWKEEKVLEELEARPLGGDDEGGGGDGAAKVVIAGNNNASAAAAPFLLILVEQIEEEDYQFVYFGGSFEGLHRVYAKATITTVNSGSSTPSESSTTATTTRVMDDVSASSSHDDNCCYLGKALFCTVGHGVLLESDGLSTWREALMVQFRTLIVRCNDKKQKEQTKSNHETEEKKSHQSDNDKLQPEGEISGDVGRTKEEEDNEDDREEETTKQTNNNNGEDPPIIFTSTTCDSDAAAAAAFQTAGIAACGFTACAPTLAAFGLMIGNPIVLGLAVTATGATIGGLGSLQLQQQQQQSNNNNNKEKELFDKEKDTTTTVTTKSQMELFEFPKSCPDLEKMQEKLTYQAKTWLNGVNEAINQNMTNNWSKSYDS